MTPVLDVFPASLLPPPFAARKLLRFEQYTSTRLLAQFDEDLPQIQKISMRISTGNVIGPRYKIRLLRIRFTPLDRPERWEQNPPEEEEHFCPLGRNEAANCPSRSSPQAFNVSL